MSRACLILLSCTLASPGAALAQGTVHRLPREVNTAANEYLPVQGVLEGQEVLYLKSCAAIVKRSSSSQLPVKCKESESETRKCPSTWSASTNWPF